MVFPIGVWAQQRAEYNRKGDEAMKRQDYRDAKMWYEEGVSYCDMYSIDKLTEIWIKDESSRSSMRSLMSKCLNCLNVLGTEQDTTAIHQLILYYQKGISTPVSDELSEYWTEKLEQVRNQMLYVPSDEVVSFEEKKERMKFFIGYQYAIEAPYGLTVGGVGKRLGWYVRFKTNMSFDKYYTAECNSQNGGELIESLSEDAYYFTNERKKSLYAFTGGLVIKCTNWLYTSVGVGYGERTLLYEYYTIDHQTGTLGSQSWAKHLDASYVGVAGDIDVMCKLGPVYLSVGCNTINFKYADLNAGVGVFF